MQRPRIDPPLLAVAVILLTAMLVTLCSGEPGRSRHGYGLLVPTQGLPCRTG
ncbi:MAG: hypothetical protein RQ723_11305 [Desulfuromonadales bacterium]|nr:hypothetical protein [Desulfuromonadales bacterium]